MNIFYLFFTGKKGDCIISLKDSDLVDMASGKLGPQKVCSTYFGLEC